MLSCISHRSFNQQCQMLLQLLEVLTQRTFTLLQDASQRLHLAMLLHDSPIIAHALLTSVRGAKYFDVFVLELGCEMRVNVSEVTPRPLDASWNRVTGCVHPLVLETHCTGCTCDSMDTALLPPSKTSP